MGHVDRLRFWIDCRTQKSFRESAARLSGSYATIHGQVDSSDEAALVRSEEHGCGSKKLIRGSKPPHRNHFPEAFACTLWRPFGSARSGRRRPRQLSLPNTRRIPECPSATPQIQKG